MYYLIIQTKVMFYVMFVTRFKQFFFSFFYLQKYMTTAPGKILKPAAVLMKSLWQLPRSMGGCLWADAWRETTGIWAVPSMLWPTWIPNALEGGSALSVCSKTVYESCSPVRKISRLISRLHIHVKKVKICEINLTKRSGIFITASFCKQSSSRPCRLIWKFSVHLCTHSIIALKALYVPCASISLSNTTQYVIPLSLIWISVQNACFFS